MNLQSWVLLLIIVVSFGFIVYNRIKKQPSCACTGCIHAKGLKSKKCPHCK
ncbi:MAG: hypothetical protein SOZ89_02275 [Peptoniphilaceae bacterium]|nr:hypothetical protein [Peptoniphilaceae bacterium]MDD7382774.1 hypothetical protein [Peptoniphilaceae bacterium]MDY3737930.1 hypothetical protein [Peptoniphilaceae bacterium]